MGRKELRTLLEMTNTNTLIEEFNNFFKKDTESDVQILFSVANYHQALLISTATDISHLLDDDNDLYNLITDIEEIPKEAGIYKGMLHIHSFTSNHPEDPVEWDITYSLKDVTKVEVNTDTKLVRSVNLTEKIILEACELILKYVNDKKVFNEQVNIIYKLIRDERE